MDASSKKKEQMSRYNIGIAVARFNESITRELLRGALRSLEREGVPAQNISVVWVPGAFELPLMAQQMANGRANRHFDAVICLGAVIRGGTPHFDYVCSSAADGVMKVGLKSDIPVIFGVLTTDNLEQALERAGDVELTADQIAAASHDANAPAPMRNKGCEAAEAAVEMLCAIDGFVEDVDRSNNDASQKLMSSFLDGYYNRSGRS